MIGTVTFFNAHKGYGFVRPDSMAKEILIRAHDLVGSNIRELAIGMRISFEVVGKGKTRVSRLRMLSIPV